MLRFGKAFEAKRAEQKRIAEELERKAREDARLKLEKMFKEYVVVEKTQLGTE